MNDYWKGFTRGVKMTEKILGNIASKEGKTMEKMEMGFDFVSEMEGWLKARGFEEDEFAEGNGRTFRDAFQTVYFESWGGKEGVYVSNSNHGNPWDDPKHCFFELPKEEAVLKSIGFQKFLLDVIEALQEDKDEG